MIIVIRVIVVVLRVAIIWVRIIIGIVAGPGY